MAKRLLAMLLAVALVLGILPMGIMAEGASVEADSAAALIEALKTGGEVKLTGDVELTTIAEIPADKTVVLDLNGFTVSSETGIKAYLKNLGSLTIRDSVGTGKITVTAPGSDTTTFYGVYNDGKLTLESGEIAVSVNGGGNAYGIYSNTGDLTVTGGTVRVQRGSTSTAKLTYVLGLGGNGKVTIEGGSFEATSENANKDTRTALLYLIKNGVPTITIVDGTFTATGVNAHGASIIRNNGSTNKNAKLNIQGGDFSGVTAGDEGLFNVLGAVTLTGGTFSADVTDKLGEDYVQNADGSVYKEVATAAELSEALAAGGYVQLSADIALETVVQVPADKKVVLNLNGKTISSETGIKAYLKNLGSLTIRDSVGTGKITVTAPGSDTTTFYGVYNDGKLTLESGEIAVSVNGGGNAYGIYSNTGDLTVTGGTVRVQRGSTSTAKLTYVLGLGGNGKVTIEGGSFEATSENANKDTRTALLYLIKNGVPTITIVDGTFTATGVNAHGASIIRNNGSTNKDAKLNIQGGEFSGVTAGDEGLFNVLGTVTVTGGTYSTDVTAYLAEGYAQNADGTVVKADDIVVPDPTHPHKLCNDTACTDHADVAFQDWTEADSLPVSGNICLQTDVTLTAQVAVAGKLNICLNGHTITVNKANTRAFALGNGSTLSITDCQGTGKLTGGSCKYGGAVSVSRGATFNLFAGAITGNSALTEEGGAIYAVGGNDSVKTGAVVNMYGGEISNNTARVGAAIRLTSPSGAGTMAQFNMYGGKITGNESTSNGAAIQCPKAIVNLYGGEISGNTAGGKGAVYVGNDAQVLIRDVKITGNTAANGGGMYVVAETATVTLEGGVSVLGNTSGGAANNLFLDGEAILTLATLSKDAKVGISAAVGNRAISAQTAADYSAQFSSDSVYKVVSYKDQALFLGASDSHKHCICMADAAGCDHTAQVWQAWESTTSLPTSDGNFYLLEDVVLSDAAAISAKTNICLNGHTISIKEGKTNVRLLGVSTGAVLSITDCQGTGKLTGGSRTYGAAVNIAKNGTFNLYGGTITGNESLVEGQSYGTVYAGGAGAVVNVYGGAISDNQVDAGGAVYGVTNTTINIYGGTISGNSATRGGALYGNKANINICGGTISGNRAAKTGGAVYANGCVTNIEKAVFAENRSTSSGGALYITGVASQLNVTGATFRDNASDGYAAGTILVQSNDTAAVIKDSAFTGSKAQVGGAIYASYNTTLTVENTTFTGNNAYRGACLFTERATVYLNKVVMDGNTVSSTTKGTTLRGAGIYMAGGEMTLEEFVLKNSSGTNSEGKATGTGVGITVSYSDETKTVDGKEEKIRHGATLNFVSGTISNNRANSGTILLLTKATMNMQGGEIKNNTGTYGAAVYASSNSTFTMTGGTISGNKATTAAGGVYGQQATVNLKGGTITGNVAKNGGGVFVSGSKLYLSGTVISYNKAESGSGGGIGTGAHKVNDVPYGTTFIMTGGRITNNESKNGGGVVHQGKGSVFELRGGLIANNNSKGDGGGVYASSNTTFRMSGATITGNKASGRGGAVMHLNSVGDYTSGLITDNHADNTAGGVQIGGTKSDVKIRNVTFRDNSGVKYGGTVQINGGVGYLENVEITNSTSEVGGAIYVGNNMTFRMVDCKISNATSSKSGGAMHLGNNSHTEIEGTTFENCKSGKYGGAIHSRSQDVVCKDLTFIGNEAVDCGGAINLRRPTLQGVTGNSDFRTGFVLDGAVFRDNKSGNLGGAVCVDIASKFYATNIVAEDNMAAEEGGAIYAGGDMTLNGLTATGNIAKEGGYAVYIADSQYDGHSYIVGIVALGGDMIVKDNHGGDLYMGEKTTAAVMNGQFGEKTEMHVTIASGVLTNKLFGSYNYEGGDLVYTVTYGDRSVTEPEYDPSLETADETQEKTETDSGDALLYVGIGVIGLAAIAAAVLLILKKKKPAKAEN